VRLAWQYILHDRVRVLVSVAGIAFAYFLMVFQGSMLYGFMRAAASVVNASDAEIWIGARGVPCFDLGAPVPKRYAALSHGVNGVAGVAELVTGFAEYRKPGGRHQLIALVGAEPEAGPLFPIPAVERHGRVPVPEALLVDGRSAALLEVRSLPAEVELNGKRARVVGSVAGFSSFLGCPYVFTSYGDAARYLEIDPDHTMYLLVRLDERAAAGAVKLALQERLPELDVWTREEFAWRSQRYWLTQTGAGAGILAAALLGFLIRLVVASQSIYATTMENLGEYATLKALGASR
jgi:putative ABC transport system permease protein